MSRKGHAGICIRPYRQERWLFLMTTDWLKISSPPPPLNPSFEKMRRRFGIASFHPKRPKRGLRPFRVARNDQKVVCGHFGSPETTKKRFAAISGHPKRPKSGLRPFRVTRNDQKVVCDHFGRKDAAPRGRRYIRFPSFAR